MARLPLLSGAFASRSVLANAQRSINLYPEKNPKDSPVPFTFYQRPGFTPLVSDGQVLPVRGIYRATTGAGYCVIGQKVYSINIVTFALTLLGTLSTVAGTPVSFADNGVTVVIGDASAFGYTIDLASNAFNQIVDVTGIFTGAVKWDYIDTFLVWAVPNSHTFGSTHSNGVVFDPLYTAGKVAYPDPLQTLIVNRHELLLFGQLKTEIWYNAGNALFPFAQLPGAYIEHGTVAPYSVAAADIEVYWLSQDLQGTGMVLKQKGYATTRISNYGLENAIEKMKIAGIKISDAIGYTYTQRGHVFYVLCFPSADQTWVYDQSVEDPLAAWHQRCWDDGLGNGDASLHRDRSNCHAFIGGKNVVGDWQRGTLYELDAGAYKDTVNGVDSVIRCIRSFPQVTEGVDPETRQATPTDGKRVQITGFAADLECGTGLAGSTVSLRWSFDRGKTWNSTPLVQAAGDPGIFETHPRWPVLGVGRWTVLELNYQINGQASLNGGWIQVNVLKE